jgi:O-antigen/teichoic acid export membrane protein
MIVFYSDNLVISSFIGVGAVATYSIAYKVIDTSQRIVWKIVDVLIPDIAGMHVRGEFAAMLSLHNRILLYTVLLFVPLGCFLYFWGLDLLGWWVGPENVLQKSVFNVFIAFMLIHSWVHVSAIFVAAIGIHKVPSYMALFEAFVNLLLSMVLARPYGVFGVAIATLAAHVATNAWFVTWWFYRYVSKNTSCSSAQIIQHQNKPE